jgi:hypothetical protein
MENTTQIPLRNKNKEIVAYTIVDNDIVENITFACCKNKDQYAQGKLNGYPILLHRYIIGAKKGDPKVDHINGDKLDNRKINLRFVSSTQNAQNRLKKEGTSSKYIGVNKKGTKWVSKIRTSEKRLEKSFNNELHAAYWYDIQALEHYKTDTFEPNINGIEKPEDYKEPEIKEKDSLSGISITKNGSFQAKIQDKQTRIHIGTFGTREQAKKAYNKKKEEILTINLQKKVGTEITRNQDQIAIITTNKNEEILIDDDQYFDLRKYTWSISSGRYAQANIMGKMTNMHRYLLNAPIDIMVDHINHNRLDNRIYNLRLVSDTINSHNITKRTGTSSKYIGVYKRGNKFIAEIKKDGISYNLGVFDTQEKAAETRDKKAIELYEQNANLNDIAKSEEIIPITKKLGNRNTIKQENTSSKYIGVYKRGNKYSANITKDGIKYNLGVFDTQEKAAEIRDKKAIELYGQNANLNIIEQMLSDSEPVIINTSIKHHAKTKTVGTTSKYIGVYKKGNKFLAEIKKDGIKYRLGTFETEDEAAHIRDKKAIYLYGINANLNFKN